MRYFKAFEQAEKPLIVWNLWANSIQELEALGEDDNPLILQEDLVPETEFNVCPLKIEGGILVARTGIEMEAYRLEFVKRNFLNRQDSKLELLNKGTFIYDSETFPMDERSRCYYLAIEKISGNHKIMTSDGLIYNLIDTGTNVADFFAAYYEKTRLITQPDVDYA